MGAFLTGFGSGISGGAKKAATDMKMKYSRKKSDSSDSGSPGGLEPLGGGSDTPTEYKKGGKVKRTGMAKVHKGERVLNKKQAKRYERKRGRK